MTKLRGLLTPGGWPPVVLITTVLLGLSVVLLTVEAPAGDSFRPVDAKVDRQLNEAYRKLPIAFEVNQGQADTQVRFVSRGNGFTLFLTETEAVLAIVSDRERNAGGGSFQGGGKNLLKAVALAILTAPQSQPVSHPTERPRRFP